MKRSLYILAAITGVFMLYSCNSAEKRDQVAIEKLEKEIEGNPDTDLARELIDKYQAFVKAYPDNHEWDSRYLYRAAGLSFRMNRFSEAIEFLNEALNKHYPGSNTPNNALLLGAIYEEKLRNEVLAVTIYQAGAVAFPEVEDFQSRVPAGTPPLTQRLEELEQSVFDDASGRIDYRVANDFINAATLHAMLLPEDPEAPAWLFRAAETARGIRAFSKSLELYQMVSDRFPESEAAAQALFLSAFTLDNDLNRFEEARTIYQAFLDRYPENEFSDDAQFLLDNLGKDEEDIIRAFEEKNQLQK